MPLGAIHELRHTGVVEEGYTDLVTVSDGKIWGDGGFSWKSVTSRPIFFFFNIFAVLRE